MTAYPAGFAGFAEVSGEGLAQMAQMSGLPTPDEFGTIETLVSLAAAESAMRAEIDRLMPSMDELSSLATEPPREWLDDKSWSDYDP